MKQIILEIKKVTQGWKITTPERTYYIGEYGWQGVYYKDDEAYEKGEGVCYIPEYGFQNIEQNTNELFEFSAKSMVSEDLTNNPYIFYEDGEGCAYTRKDFLAITDGNEEIAKDLFDSVDWESPETIYDEMDFDEE